MYGKHFQSMYSGSMVGMGAIPFAVWGYIISHQQPPNFDVELNPKILAVIIGEEEMEVAKAIEQFCQPDPKSRTEANEGRKLVRLGEYLFHVVNGKQYNDIRTNEERREYWREQKRKKRVETLPPSPPVNPPTPPETPLPKPTNPPEKYHTDSRAILHFLNEASGKRFRETDANLETISARLCEKDVSSEGVKTMISRMCKRWKATEYEEYLQPSTLFGKKKFDNYYANREQPLPVNVGAGNGQSPKIIAPVRGSEPVGGF